MLMPCDTFNPCPTDLAIENLSAEEPDQDQLLAFYSKFILPNLGTEYSDGELPGYGTSFGDQLSATNDARNNSIQNTQRGSITGANINKMPPPVVLPTKRAVIPFIYRGPLRRRLPTGGHHGMGQFFRINPGDKPPIGPYFNHFQECSAWCPSGKIFVGEQAPFTVIGKTQDDADAIAKVMACAKAQKDRVCFVPLTTGPFCLGQHIDIPVVVANGTGQHMDLSMPKGVPGLGFKQTGANRASLSGNPTEVGEYDVEFMAVSPDGLATKDTFKVKVWGFTTFNPTLVVGVSSAFSWAASGPAKSPFLFSSPDTMPPGLTLHSDGTLTGIPTTAGTYPVEMRVIDQNQKGCKIQDTITVLPCQGTIIIGTAPGSSYLFQNAIPLDCSDASIPSGATHGAVSFCSSYQPVWNNPDYTCLDDPPHGFFCANLEARVNFNYLFTITNPCPFAQNLKITQTSDTTGGFLVNGIGASGVVPIGPGTSTCELQMGFHVFFRVGTYCKLGFTFEFI